MPTTELSLVQRTQQVVANLENPAFSEQLEALLPDTVPLRRFIQIAKTAIISNPDLVGADQDTLFASIVRCAQDGLQPDNHEAALVPYKGKVSYLPMVAGLRKVAAEYGWTIKASVVFENDDFDWSEEPPTITHKPVRPGMERGDRVAAYAIATHRDGRRLQKVMYADEIAKVRAKAQTQAVWNEWTDQMWMKSPAKAVVKVLPLAERDRIERLVAADFVPEGSSAAELLYGPREDAPPTVTPTDAHPSPTGPDGGSGQQVEAAAASPSSAASAPGDEPITDGEFEPIEDEAPAVTPEEYAAAATTKVTAGAWKDKTLGEIAEDDDEGPKWLLVQLKKASPGSPQHTKLAIVIQSRLPETWALYETWLAEKS